MITFFQRLLNVKHGFYISSSIQNVFKNTGNPNDKLPYKNHY